MLTAQNFWDQMMYPQVQGQWCQDSFVTHKATHYLLPCDCRSRVCTTPELSPLHSAIAIADVSMHII